VAPPTVCVFSAWHLPKVLIRKSAIRACSGASTLKDQNLGQVPGGGEKKKKSGSAPYQKNTPFSTNGWRGARGAKKLGMTHVPETTHTQNCRWKKEGKGTGTGTGTSTGTGIST